MEIPRNAGLELAFFPRKRSWTIFKGPIFFTDPFMAPQQGHILSFLHLSCNSLQICLSFNCSFVARICSRYDFLTAGNAKILLHDWKNVNVQGWVLCSLRSAVLALNFLLLLIVGLRAIHRHSLYSNTEPFAHVRVHSLSLPAESTLCKKTRVMKECSTYLY